MSRADYIYVGNHIRLKDGLRLRRIIAIAEDGFVSWCDQFGTGATYGIRQ